MARLPNPGGDEGTWGNVLNQYLLSSHNTDGSLKTTAVSDSISDSSITHAKLAAGSVTLDKLSTTNLSTAGQVLTSDGSGLSWQTAASGVTDHTFLSNIGSNTHAQIDSHISDMNTHVAASTSVHGIADTSDLVVTGDLGGAATLDVGTTAGTVAAGDDARLTSAVQPGDALTELGSGTATNGQIATADGVGNVAWEDAPSAGASALDDLTDVDTSTAAPSDGQALIWQTNTWVPGDATSGLSQVSHGGWYPNPPSGKWVPVSASLPGSALITAINRVHGTPIMLPVGSVITDLAFEITMAASGTLHILVYKTEVFGSGSGPCVAVLGAIDASSTGIKTITGLSHTVAANEWLFIVFPVPARVTQCVAYRPDGILPDSTTALFGQHYSGLWLTSFTFTGDGTLPEHWPANPIFYQGQAPYFGAKFS